MKWVWMLLALTAGMAVSVQAGVNGGLGKRVGVLEGAFISFLIGTVVLFLVQLFLGKGELLAMFSVPKWQLTGGILGAFLCVCHGADRSESRRRQFIDGRGRRAARDEFDH